MVESSSSSPGAANKRNRDPEDEAYLDNFHSHKRYLSEIMASSLNGLTVGESLSEHLLDSPARSETMNYLRDDICMQFCPMSEDCDDGRYSESQSQSQSRATSPSSSPHRYQRSSSTSSLACSHQARQRGGSDSEGRFPSSPSDICHSADLRRAALLRSVQMRVVHHPAAAADDSSLPSSPEQDSISQNMEAEYHHPCSCQNQQQIPNVECCCSVKETESQTIGHKPCRVLHMNNVKEEVCEERTSLRKHDVLSSSSSSSKRSILGESQ